MGEESVKRLAVSSWSWHDAYYRGRWSLLDQPGAAVALGLMAIECNDFMLPPPRWSRIRRPLLSLLPGAPPELWRYSRHTLQSLRAGAVAEDVHIAAWTVNSDFAVSASNWPAQRLYLRRALNAAVALDVPLLRVNLGGAPETPLERDPAIVQRLTRFVRRAVSRSSKITVAVENHWGISTDIERHLRLVDAAAARLPAGAGPRFGCCFDPANLPDIRERDPRWRALARRAVHYHLKTTTPDETGRIHNLPHAYLFELLREAGYSGGVAIEFAGDGSVTRGVTASAELYRRHWGGNAGS